MGTLGRSQVKRENSDIEATRSRRITRSMTATDSGLKTSFRITKNAQSRERSKASPEKKSRKSSKSEIKIEAKLEDIIIDDPSYAQSQVEYVYTKAFIPGVTSIETFGQSRGSWRLIKSEYAIPISKFVEPEDEVVLIQNSIAHSLYALIVQAILWNQTSGRQARPVLNSLLARYPDPQTLSEARPDELAEMLYPIGLYNSRAKRLIDMARTWVAQPPLPGRGYGRTRDRKYVAVPLAALEEEEEEDDDDDNGDGGPCGRVKQELSDELAQAHAQSRPEFWEVAHLPGVGPYALDSFRIFHRDEMRGLAADWLGAGAGLGFEPEWKRVVPADKDLRAYLKYRWMREGWDWDPLTGKKKRVKAGS